MLKSNEAVIILLCVSVLFTSCEQDQLAEGEGEPIILVKEESTYRSLEDIGTIYVSLRGKRPLSGLYYIIANETANNGDIQKEYYFAVPFDIEWKEKSILRRFNGFHYIRLIIRLDNPVGFGSGDKIVVDIGKYIEAFDSNEGGGIVYFNQIYAAKIVRNITEKRDIEQ